MLNISPFFDRQYKVYSENVKSRNKLHYLIGLYVRWKQHFKYERASQSLSIHRCNHHPYCYQCHNHSFHNYLLFKGLLLHLFISGAKKVQTSTMKACFQIVECSLSSNVVQR